MRRVLGLALALFACVAQAQAILPFADRVAIQSLDEDERRVWSEAGDLDRIIRQKRLAFGDRILDAYLQEVVDSLFPDFRGVIRVRVMRDVELNAFALPNGSLYLNLGLLARMENEAQLATVLAHEAAHFIHRHSYQQRQNIKSSTAFALTLGIAGGGIGSIVGNLAALSSIYGYSTDLEREADRSGAKRLVDAGYDLKEGAKVFETLDAEAKLLDKPEPFLFSSHPRLQERIENFAELSKTSNGDRQEAERFRAITGPAREAWMQAEIDLSRHKSLIYVLTRDSARPAFPAHSGYYLARAYLLRGDTGDEDKAQQALNDVLQRAPQFAPAYQALGMLHYKQGRATEAQPLFQRYLELAADSPDGGYVRQYLEQVHNAAKKENANEQVHN